jgi:hypothetical protein
MENPVAVASKRFKVHDGHGNSCSVRISANTPAPALSVIFSGRFKGQNLIAVEVDGDLVALDSLYDAVEDGKEYKAVFGDSQRTTTKICLKTRYIHSISYQYNNMVILT